MMRAGVSSGSVFGPFILDFFVVAGGGGGGGSTSSSQGGGGGGAGGVRSSVAPTGGQAANPESSILVSYGSPTTINIVVGAGGAGGVGTGAPTNGNNSSLEVYDGTTTTTIGSDGSGRGG